jgi:hypothetical protein
MQNKYQTPNRTDQAAGDFFHSKTWKTILTIWLSMFGAAGLFGCCLGALFLLGFGGAILTVIATIQQLLFPVVGYMENPPQLTPFLISTVVAQVPDLNPEPNNVNREWNSLDVYGFWVEIPYGWTLNEINPRSYNDRLDGCPNYEVDYSIDSPNRDNILITFLCGARGGESTPCPVGTVVIDENRNIARLPSDSGYLYLGVSSGAGELFCSDGWGDWGIETMAMIAEYHNSSGIYDLPIVDRIVLSVQQK